MQSDPIGLEGGENSYLYADANPLTKYDAEGKVWSLVAQGVRTVVSVGSSVVRWAISLFTKTKIPQKSIEHIFSSKHIKDGIMLLGKNKEAILKQAEKIIEKHMKNLKEGSNQIETIMNGHQATIRVFVKDGEIVSVNIFKGISNRKLGNLIKD